MALKCIFILPVLAVLLGYYFHSPLPDNITDPWTLKFIIGGYRVVNIVGKLGFDVGYDTPINISRVLFAQVFKWTSRPASSQNLKIENTMVKGIPVRSYTPADRKPEELLPVIVYFHGGGFFTFSVDTYENILREMSQETRAVIVAVEYRLAPEHPFPVPLDDCYEVAVSILTDATQFGGDATRVALAGDSAGGNLAAAVAWRLANRMVSSPILQILMYPMLQAFDFQVPSYVELNGITHEIVTREGFAMAWSLYCTGNVNNISGILGNNHVSSELKQSQFGKHFDTNGLKIPDHMPRKKFKQSETSDTFLVKEFENCVTNPEFFPLIAPDLSKFPKTYIMSAEYDILKDECFIFADRLKNAGVEVFHDYKRGAWHGIMSYTRTQGGHDALTSVINYIKENI